MCQIKEVGIDKFDREIYEQWRASGKLIPDGVNTVHCRSSSSCCLEEATSSITCASKCEQQKLKLYGINQLFCFVVAWLSNTGLALLLVIGVGGECIWVGLVGYVELV